jgi:DNA modification methylase
MPKRVAQICILAGCPEGGIVLDPFLGSGTTALVAQENGNHCIGIELNAEWVDLSRWRTQQQTLLAG